MSSETKFPLMSWSSITDEYLTKDIAYKDQARVLLIKELDFQPNLQACRVCEIGLRGELRLLEEGKITQDKFNKRLHNAVILIKKNILKRVPEQAHLFDPKDADVPFIKTS